ncbi:pyridine nucleotide-disulfide oxidoreductase [Thioflexithrix psekupsensis]|uniref:Pyridine nucleotide-disulfide oxidoreductase n=1 Tax=Thioflexithrix psekupsensis TaxID=1570016 RepID=A0A251X5I2_9GAMM|nr:pyridine nucleotide-disulfide oxidoreductase [Thioflexithrix psekupsensis]OUD12459.1 pyridine nucleotide-disulfide oxidoreductase [Thioflexithrix psekupsensis]
MSDPTSIPVFQRHPLSHWYQADVLAQLDQDFLQQLAQQRPDLAEQTHCMRQSSAAFSAIEISQWLLDCAPYLEQFIAQFFGIASELQKQQHHITEQQPIAAFKKTFVLRRARRRLHQKNELIDFNTLNQWLNQELAQSAWAELAVNDRELAVACLSQHYLTQAETHAHSIEQLTQWCIHGLKTPEAQQQVQDWASFHLPQAVDPHARIATDTVIHHQVPCRITPASHIRQRQGFALTDPRASLRQVLEQIHYCVYCHSHDGDYCAKGFPATKEQKEQNDTADFKRDVSGNLLTGCPLEEKISEMHCLKRDGYPIAALAVVMIDNPMCAATGHRICNDCMKACIYQKQDPVNIPQIETRVLTDVLALPFGVEIYDLLMRWNPLRSAQPYPKPYHGIKVLIAGQGPAGFTLAHSLLMEGFAVVGVDGLKIEPLPSHYLQQPIRDYQTLVEPLDQRLMAGFGGVAEYGITVRWDKNFLRLIYLALSRRPYYQVFGSVRFGGTVTLESAWALGFDHVAIAVGAGLPQVLPVPNSMAIGMRQANDFLMALQLTGAAKMDSLANLQVRLPAMVIGGGLTAIDTATEVQAYYLVQIEKLLTRYEQLVARYGKDKVESELDPASLAILQEQLHHAHEYRTEQTQAKLQQRPVNVQKLLHAWGGVTVAYRRRLEESPAYARNHEEVAKALEEGIFYLEQVDIESVLLDEFKHVNGVIFKSTIDSQLPKTFKYPARAILVATGAKMNVAYAFEHRDQLQRCDTFQYQTYANQQGELRPVPIADHCKSPDFGAFTSYQHQDRRVSFLGDTHPVFHGSVVKAIASGLRTAPQITRLFADRVQQQGDKKEYQSFREKLQNEFTARIIKVERQTPNVVELTVRAPAAVRPFRTGQFFRVQNFEQFAPMVNHHRLHTEAIAMIPAAIQPEKGELSLIAIEKGASSRLLAQLPVGMPLSLMGPTGARIPLPDTPETILVIGGRLAAAQMRVIGKELRKAGHRILYVAQFDRADELFRREELEAAANSILWVTTQSPTIPPQRETDFSLQGQWDTALEKYNAGELGQIPVPLSEIDRVWVLGAGVWLAQVEKVRRERLSHLLTRQPPFFGSVYSPMQCMLKGICAQCLQWQRDPNTGERTKAVFACSWQMQAMDHVDVDNLTQRLQQNRLQEVISDQWLTFLLEQAKDL